MSAPILIEKRPWLERVVIGIGGSLALMGLATLAGRGLDLNELRQPFEGLPALTGGAAVGWGMLGLAMVAGVLGNRRLLMITACAAALPAFGAWVGEVAFLPTWAGGLAAMGKVQSAGLALGSLALGWRALGRPHGAGAFAEAAIGSVLAAGGLSILLGYGANLPETFGGSGAPVPPVGAMAAVLAGLALIGLGWREATQAAGGNAPFWSPMPPVIVCFALTTLLWLGLRRHDPIPPRVADSVAPARALGDLPRLALGAGFGLTLLLGISVHLARRARAGQRAAELLNFRLFAENEERRRIESRLKISDERLRLALDSTQIGIFEWNVAAGSIYYSPGLWTMLGYEPARMPSTVEVWHSLIHPDDRELHHRRIASQLSGSTSFIEPEYRVQARGGHWRWVYLRSKAVATDDEGRPTRIIGTVQDITARREAELALRESQFEARKLSLVAAKTDNPVLIAAPDGRIEWANEAFCRVMEYRLEEVVGRNPLHFAVGAETNPRTIARICTAMARGQSISTDLVNYSKSGRKFHLHLEIQPVHGADGEIENFIAVETDITGRVATEEQLRRAKLEADDASRAKSEFLASMSHEIRTPMNGVIGMTSLLLESPLNAEQRDFVSTIRTSGEALLTIINDILDFSKIESGKLELECSPFELSLCLEESLDLFALQASAKRLEIGYHLAPDVPTWIMGDATRLRQVVVNLINNAVKFTPSGSISIEVRRLAGDSAPALESDADPARAMLEFTVRDTGIGIPADRIDRLFKAFSQVDSSTTRKYGGTGLGLAISQRLCQLMGGSIRVESALGRGTSFIFTFPTTAAPSCSDSGLNTTPEPLRGGWVLCVEDHPVTQARLRSLIGNWGVECIVVTDAPSALEIAAQRACPPALLVFDADNARDENSPLEVLSRIKCPRFALFPFGQTPPAPPADGQPFAGTTKPLRTISFLLGIVGLFQAARGRNGMRTIEQPIGEEIPLEVLLAEDNAVNQKVALRFLERLGYRADAVANGLEAVTTLENRRYDLVLMDLQMPEMDGIEATRQIRIRLPAGRQPKIFALTANAMQGDRELCVAAGMDDYISKPVKIHEISEVIRRHFGKTEAVAERLIA